MVGLYLALKEDYGGTELDTTISSKLAIDLCYGTIHKRRPHYLTFTLSMGIYHNFRKICNKTFGRPQMKSPSPLVRKTPTRVLYTEQRNPTRVHCTTKPHTCTLYNPFPQSGDVFHKRF